MTDDDVSIPDERARRDHLSHCCFQSRSSTTIVNQTALAGSSSRDSSQLYWILNPPFESPDRLHRAVNRAILLDVGLVNVGHPSVGRQRWRQCGLNGGYRIDEEEDDTSD